MLREKALKALGKPNVGSRRIFNDEISTMLFFYHVQSDNDRHDRLYHKILPWEKKNPLLIGICGIINDLQLAPCSTNRRNVDDLWLLSLNDFHCFSPSFGCQHIAPCSQIHRRSDSESCMDADGLSRAEPLNIFNDGMLRTVICSQAY